MKKTYAWKEVDCDLNAIYMQHLMENVVPSYIEELADPEDVLEVVIKPLFRELDEELAEECVRYLYQQHHHKIYKGLFKKQTPEKSEELIRKYLDGVEGEDLDLQEKAKGIIGLFGGMGIAFYMDESGLG